MTNITKDECAKYYTLHSEPFPCEKLWKSSIDFDLRVEKNGERRKKRENKKKTTKYQPFRILKLQALENTLICYSTLKHATLCPNGELLDF